MISMRRTWREVRVPPARAVVRSPAERPWAGTKAARLALNPWIFGKMLALALNLALSLPDS